MSRSSAVTPPLFLNATSEKSRRTIGGHHVGLPWKGCATLAERALMWFQT